jgi:CheY-like chemotaxis protein
MCAKINSKASPNGIAIGDGLYNIVQSISLLPFLEEKNLYHLEEIIVEPNHDLSQFNQYRVYALQSNNKSVSNQSSLQQEQEQEPTHSPNIFLVDDEEDILYTFKKGLSSEGYNVEAFSDSMEALRHFAKVNPSHYKLAVLDIRMPGLNGLQLYYRLKSINRNIKILFVSALDAVPELMSILPDAKTTDDIIRKPVALDDFINAVKTALVQ